jgi:hypothetical protein
MRAPIYPGLMLIKVMDDYGCAPLWVKDGDEDLFLPYEPEDLGLSPSLAGRLQAWRQWYESMINFADAHDSRPVDEPEWTAFDTEGRHLAARVAEELPHATVWFHRDPEPAA